MIHQRQKYMVPSLLSLPVALLFCIWKPRILPFQTRQSRSPSIFYDGSCRGWFGVPDNTMSSRKFSHGNLLLPLLVNCAVIYRRCGLCCGAITNHCNWVGGCVSNISVLIAMCCFQRFLDIDGLVTFLPFFHGTLSTRHTTLSTDAILCNGSYSHCAVKGFFFSGFLSLFPVSRYCR